MSFLNKTERIYLQDNAKTEGDQDLKSVSIH